MVRSRNRKSLPKFRADILRSASKAFFDASPALIDFRLLARDRGFEAVVIYERADGEQGGDCVSAIGADKHSAMRALLTAVQARAAEARRWKQAFATVGKSANVKIAVRKLKKLRLNKKMKSLSAILVLHGGRDVENILVEKKKGRVYRVRTIPFWAYNLSFGDLVECRPDEDGEGLFIKRVTKKSGNRTVRVAFQGKGGVSCPEGVKLRRHLKGHKLAYEVFKPAMVAINVPSAAYDRLCDYLEKIPKSAKMIAEDGDPQPNRNLDGSRPRRSKRES